jgi:hypothetical protein
MQISISEPEVLDQFKFNTTNFDIFHSQVGDYTFCRSVSYQNWPVTSVKVNGQMIGLGEDPRAFDLFGIPACYAVRFNEVERFVPQLFLQNEDEWMIVNIKVPNTITPGKNWSPFTYNDSVYFVHEVSPFRVLRLAGDVATVEFEYNLPAEVMPIDNYSVLRGGSNGLDVGDGIVLGFGHDNYADNHYDINTIRHRPYPWVVNMKDQTVGLPKIDFAWDSRYNIIDPTAFIVKDGKYFLMTCETESQWKRQVQTGRRCLYPITITR